MGLHKFFPPQTVLWGKVTSNNVASPADKASISVFILESIPVYVY